MVAALPAAEIAELMRLPQNQNKVPLPIGLGPKVVVAEVSSTVPNLVFDGMASVTIYFVFDGAYSKGIGTDGDLVKFTVLIGQRHCGFYLPKRYESKVSAVGRLGELMAVFDGGTKMVSTAAIGGHELAVACNTDGKARFEDVLTNSRGQMVVFSGK
ncbi:MAG: hypothetical protein NT169_04980 [Chloroflexi bacterium]|nr:hypothetical protein [Chloroflexota bacterium]